MRVCACVYVPVRACVCMCAPVYVCVYVCACACLCVHVCMYARECACVYVGVCESILGGCLIVGAICLWKPGLRKLACGITKDIFCPCPSLPSLGRTLLKH